MREQHGMGLGRGYVDKRCSCSLIPNTESSYYFALTCFIIFLIYIIIIIIGIKRQNSSLISPYSDSVILQNGCYALVHCFCQDLNLELYSCRLLYIISLPSNYYLNLKQNHLMLFSSFNILLNIL